MGDLEVDRSKRIASREFRVNNGNVVIKGRAALDLDGATLQLGAGNPLLAIKVVDFGRLRVRGSKIEGFAVEATSNGEVELSEARVGRVHLSSRSRLAASKSSLGEVVMTSTAQATLSECDIDTLTLRFERVAVELARLKTDEPADWSFEPIRGYRVELKQCRVRRYAVEVTAGTRVEISDTPRVAILFEIDKEVCTFDDLKTGRHEEALITNRTAGISVRLNRVGVDEWGLRALEEAGLSARRSQIGRVEALRRTRVVLIDCDVEGTLSVGDRSTLELEGSRIGSRALLQAMGNGRCTITRSRFHPSARLFGYESGLFDVWETGGVPRPILQDQSKILVEGREMK